MKRTALLLVALITIASCTSEKEIIEKESPKLLKKQIGVRSYDDDNDPDTPLVETTSTGTFEYNEEYELLKVTHESLEGNEETIFTYTNGKITRIEERNSDGNINSYREYEYTGDLNTKVTEYNSEGEIDGVENYEYNSDSKLIKKIEEQFFNGTKYTHVTNYEYISDNKVKEIEEDSYTIYTFDDKNSPYLSITGFKAILHSITEGVGNGTNATLVEEYDKDNNLIYSYSLEYKYDADNFVIEGNESTEGYTYNVTYEYNK